MTLKVKCFQVGRLIMHVLNVPYYGTLYMSGTRDFVPLAKFKVQKIWII